MERGAKVAVQYATTAPRAAARLAITTHGGVCTTAVCSPTACGA